jgi:hypothetical protein
MGTNYYMELEPGEYKDDHLWPTEKEFINDRPYLHIGKSSCGWCFTCHTVPALQLNDWKDWKRFLQGRKILNEYYEDVSYEEMVDTVENRSHPTDFNKPPEKVWEGWYDLEEGWDEILRKNHAEKGPNGLFRHQVDPERGESQGEGTWDNISGTFS